MIIKVSVSSVLLILRPPPLLVLPAHRLAGLYHVIPGLCSVPSARLPPGHQTRRRDRLLSNLVTNGTGRVRRRGPLPQLVSLSEGRAAPTDLVVEGHVGLHFLELATLVLRGDH